jgi:uncharacterized membrane protein YtjA (UPF0391 family)
MRAAGGWYARRRCRMPTASRAYPLQLDGHEAREGRQSGGHGAEKSKEIIMLYYAALFFVIALVAALFGFGGIAAGAVEIAKILFFVFLVLFVVSLIAGLMRRGGPRV